jgi:DNA mismatch endonuclease (patch repair protein)
MKFCHPFLLLGKTTMDKYSPETRSRMMSAVRSRGNRTTEKRLRAHLIRAGIRGWSVHPAGITGAPDFVFAKEKVAIFVDGAFWHGAPGFNRFPKTRVEFWTKKIERNKQRDLAVSRALRAKGWSVRRFWDYQLERDSRGVVSVIRECLKRREGI